MLKIICRNVGTKADELIQLMFRKGGQNGSNVHQARCSRLSRVAPGIQRVRQGAQGNGRRGARGLRAVAKPNEVTVSHDFATISKAKTFAGSRRLREVMKGAGVQGTPTIWFVKPT